MAYIGFRPYPDSDATKIVHLPEVVSATFLTGDLVILSGGFVTVATDDKDVFGIAMKDYTGTTSALIPVYVITPEDRFIAQSTATTAETNKGVAYGVDVATPGSMAVTVGTTGDAVFYIDELDPRDGPTTGAGGRVIGRFIISAADAIGG